MGQVQLLGQSQLSLVLQVNTANGGQRVGTVLMYLTDVEEGGETVFPSSLDHPVITSTFDACNFAPLEERPSAIGKQGLK